MSDVMLFGVLRIPVTADTDALTIHLFASRAREAADRIESDAKEIERLRSALQEVAEEGERWTHSGLMAIAAEALGKKA